jgi:hypothetical protein
VEDEVIVVRGVTETVGDIVVVVRDIDEAIEMQAV